MTTREFAKIVSEAITDLETHGFDNISRLERWQREIEYAAERELKSESIIYPKLKNHLSKIYASQIDKGNILKSHSVPQWKLEKLKPKLRNELDRRLMASAQLIKLNREEMILRTQRRFAGWVTSLPIGGSEAIDKREIAGEIKKSLKQLPFEERRVMIDQAAKFRASLDSIIATDGGAIAAEWNVRKTAGYENRPEHLKRDGKIYIIKNSWAMKEGLIKSDGHEYTSEIDQPGEKIFCECNFRYIYNLREVPQLLTEKGRNALNKI